MGAIPLSGDVLEPLGIPTGKLFHIGLAVPDIGVAQKLLGPALGVTFTAEWGFDIVLETPKGKTTTPIKAIYTRQGPPFLEIIQGPPGSFFGSGEMGRLHHAGIIVEDVDAERRRLEALGLTCAGHSGSVAFMSNETGLQLEIMAEGVRDTLDRWFAS